jgi:release factor glutamine methyltransferase
MAEGLQVTSNAPRHFTTISETYDACFDNGHHFRLLDRKETFRVSQAGLALGDYLVRNVRESELAGRVLDVGTGSGAIALLLRDMGASTVAATDICASSLSTAKENELANFGDSIIDFSHGDLFPDAGSGRQEPFDLIVFNPPGWRTPSETLKAALDREQCSLNSKAMFYGDSVLLRFLEQLRSHLTANGRAIVGFNSLIGIRDIIERSRSIPRPRDCPTINFRVLERIEIPLLFYTDEWAELRAALLAEFERGRREYAATYVTKDDSIHWFYEITEVTVGDSDDLVLSGRQDDGQLD